MAGRKRIAVLIGQADEDYQKRFITGFLKQAFSHDMDACILSMYRKYQDMIEREKGETNIFRLFHPDVFDGVVFVKDTIQTGNIADVIEHQLHEYFSGPVLVIERESEHFDSVFTDGYASMAAVVRHMIEVHHFKDIAFLNGKRWHEHSMQRLAAFRDEMAKHDLTVDEDRIFYGDFWYKSGEECADKLISSGRLPEAVVCANDAMAIGLCEALEKRGITIPDQIAVASYDSTEEGQTSPKTITSAVIPAFDCGSYAADYMYAKFRGRDIGPFETHPNVVVGESCGCKTITMPSLSRKRTEWATDISSAGFDSVNNTMAEDVQSQTSLEDLIRIVFNYAYQIKGAESFHLCIAEPWKNMGHDSSIHVRNEGYPERMIYAVRYNNTQQDTIVGVQETFPTKEILPDLYEKREKPTAYIFTPVFSENECYGYAVVSYGSVPRSYDDIYRRWVNLVARGLESTRRYNVIQLLDEQVGKLRTGKFAVGGTPYDHLSTEEKEICDLVEKILDENLLNYRFQPIVRATDGEIYSYEALMRARTEIPVSPLDIIKYSNILGRLPDVEYATFMNVLNILEEHRADFGRAKVFINSIPGVKMDEDDYNKMAKLLEKNADIAVVELTEEAELSDDDLNRLKEFFRKLNVEIAVDDYGTGYSNVSNLLRYMPNYVKIDRSLLSDIPNKPQKQHFVREIIDFCHDNHIMALAEGVETTEELEMVIHLGADLIQGFYTARPEMEIVPSIPESIKTEIKRFHQERVDGVSKHIYVAGRTNRVTLSALVKGHYTDMVVGKDTPVYKDITVVGTPQVSTGVHLTVMPDYSGIITLENAYLSNEKNRPVIEIGENSDVTLVLVGENILNNAGIHVPESSSLRIEGDGSLKIHLNTSDSYGIGADAKSRHGSLIFRQNGQIAISVNGRRGLCIGSGLGGPISIEAGQYLFDGGSATCVGVGSYTGDAKISVTNCLLESELSATEGVCVGSIEGDVDITIKSTFFKSYGGGNEYVSIGTLRGEHAKIHASEDTLEINLRSGYSTAVGALEGNSDIDISYTGIYFDIAGKKALAFGGCNENTKIRLKDSDTRVDIHTGLGKDTFAPEDQITIINGRCRFSVNDEGLERNLIFDMKQ